MAFGGRRQAAGSGCVSQGHNARPPISTTRTEVVMTTVHLTSLLAERVMGWRVCPDRFIKSGRSWIPKWRFRPFACLEDAFSLLDRTGGTYTLAVDLNGVFTAEVRVCDRIGKVAGHQKARTITLAVVQALGLEALGGDK